MLTGKLEERNGKLYVVWTDYLDSSPVCRRLWWKIEGFRAECGRHPEVGDTVSSSGDSAEWRAYREGQGSKGTVYTIRGAQAEIVEETPVSAPKIRKGTEIRWKHGKWEKYSKRQGWISA